jgi:hypothetical protein
MARYFKSGAHVPDIILVTLIAILAEAFYAHSPIGIEGDARVYLALARFFAGDAGGAFAYYRPPGYPAFLVLTGLVHLNTFRYLLLANAVIGFLCPLLVYVTVAPLGRLCAVSATLIYVASTLPFTYSNLLLAEHLFTFLILLATMAMSRFIQNGRPIYIYAATVWTLFSVFTRNEAWLVLALVLLVVTVSSLAHPWRLVHVGCALLLTLSVLLYWSSKRSQYMHDPAAFGSLSNFSGRQFFGRTYAILGPFDYQLNTRILRRRISPSAICPTDLGVGTCLIQASNGRGSRRLVRLIDRYMNGRAEELLRHPTQTSKSDIGSLVIDKLGYERGDQLLLRVAIEAYWRHPTAILAILSSSLDYLGISTVEFFGFPAAPPGTVGGLFLARVWKPDEFETIPYNHAGIALEVLQGRAREEYANSFNVSSVYMRVHHGAQILSIWIITAVGLAFLLAMPLILFRAVHTRGTGLFVLVLTAILLVAAVLGFGYSPKYHHTIFPLMVMSGAFGVAGLKGTSYTTRRSSQSAIQ